MHTKLATGEKTIAAIKAALPDSEYADSKDWVASDIVNRIEWLKDMYLARKLDTEELLDNITASQEVRKALKQIAEVTTCNVSKNIALAALENKE